MSEFLDENDEILDKEGVSGVCNKKLNRKTVDYLVATNQIPYIRVGRRKVLFSKNRIKQWLKDRENVELKYNTKK